MVGFRFSEPLQAIPELARNTLHFFGHYRPYREHGDGGLPRKGNCLDNAPMQSLFATIKSELFYPGHLQTVENLNEAIKDCRIKLKLKGLSPMQYRTQPLNLPAP